MKSKSFQENGDFIYFLLVGDLRFNLSLREAGNEKWMPDACGYWESISVLSIKLWVALIEFYQKPQAERS